MTEGRCFVIWNPNFRVLSSLQPVTDDGDGSLSEGFQTCCYKSRRGSFTGLRSKSNTNSHTKIPLCSFPCCALLLISLPLPFMWATPLPYPTSFLSSLLFSPLVLIHLFLLPLETSIPSRLFLSSLPYPISLLPKFSTLLWEGTCPRYTSLILFPSLYFLLYCLLFIIIFHVCIF